MFIPFDRYYLILVIPALLFAGWAQMSVSSAFSRYSRVRNMRGMTGAQAARRILDDNGLQNVRVEHIGGKLTDHYDPGAQVVRLSDSVYAGDSIASLGVAAHECGHAAQHATGYAPLKFRGALVPAANFGSTLAWPLILIGLFLRSDTAVIFINMGILLFSAAVLFQLVTLPVEFNASSRAVKVLETTGMLYPEEIRQTKAVLGAAALTYVASAASAILQLLRLLLITGRRRND